MIIRKGTRVVFDFDAEGKRFTKAPPSWGMMHDPDGEDWPQDSVLVLPYRVTGEPVDYAPARHYFGSGWDTQAGTFTTPPIALSAWGKPLGQVDRIWYTRLGTSHPGPFQHKVNGGWETALFGKKRAVLYRRPGAYRLEFPDGLRADARGFVRP